jgi:hypothetical protein
MDVNKNMEAKLKKSLNDFKVEVGKFKVINYSFTFSYMYKVRLSIGLYLDGYGDYGIDVIVNDTNAEAYLQIVAELHAL